MKSNCLFEAVKAKLKDPKNVKILYWDPFINNGHWHFLWRNLKDDTITHFNEPKETSNHILFHGRCKTISFEAYEAWILDRFKGNIKNLLKLSKRFDFKSWKIPGVLTYHSYYEDIEHRNVFYGIRPTKKDTEFLSKIIRHPVYIKVLDFDKKKKSKRIRIMTIENVLKIKHEFSWKYITMFDSDYSSIFGPQLNIDKKEFI